MPNKSGHPTPSHRDHDFHHLKSSVLSEWIMALNNNSDSIREGLGILASYGSFDRIGLVLFSPDTFFGQKRFYWNSNRWIYDQDAEFFSLGEYPWLMRQLRAGKTVLIQNPDDLPSYATNEKEYFANHGIQIFIANPLSNDTDHSIIGFLHLDDTSRNSHLDDARMDKITNVFDLIPFILPILAAKEKVTALRSLLEEKDILLDNTDVQMWYMLNPTVYGKANHAHACFWGKTCPDMNQTEIYSVFDVTAGNIFADFTMDVFEKKIPIRRELSVKNHKCQERVLSVSWNPVFDEKEEVSHVVCSAQDITDLKKSQKLVSVNKALKKEIMERKQAEKNLEKALSDLRNAQAQVIQQEKLASLGQLAAGVAHEINNPMGFIISNLATLKKYIKKIEDYFTIQDEVLSGVTASCTKNNPDETAAVLCDQLNAAKQSKQISYILSDVKELLSESAEGAERVRKIVQDLKGFTRISTDDSALMDINAGLESTINIIWNELKYKVTITKDYKDNLPLIRVNSGQINQVFMNILLNAVQAIDTQGEIGVKTWGDDSFVYISISDTGCGMPEEVQRKIFEPFFTTKDVGKGTGLGLNISYEIIKKHNGEILVDSQVEKGTIFTLKLPINH